MSLILKLVFDFVTIVFFKNFHFYYSYKVSLTDEFTHPKTGLVSHCYRIIYRSWDRVLTQSEVNVIHEKIAQETVKQFSVTMR